MNYCRIFWTRHSKIRDFYGLASEFSCITGQLYTWRIVAVSTKSIPTIPYVRISAATHTSVGSLLTEFQTPWWRQALFFLSSYPCCQQKCLQREKDSQNTLTPGMPDRSMQNKNVFLVVDNSVDVRRIQPCGCLSHLQSVLVLEISAHKPHTQSYTPKGVEPVPYAGRHTTNIAWACSFSPAKIFDDAWNDRAISPTGW